LSKIAVENRGLGVQYFPSNEKNIASSRINLLKSSTATVPGMGLCGSCIWQVFSLHGFYNHTGLLFCSRTDVIVALSAGGLNSSVAIDYKNITVERFSCSEMEFMKV
jgi:hypothetical protein